MASGFRAFPILRAWRVYLPTGFDFRVKRSAGAASDWS